jgi:hypothetical protein
MFKKITKNYVVSENLKRTSALFISFIYQSKLFVFQFQLALQMVSWGRRYARRIQVQQARRQSIRFQKQLQLYHRRHHRHHN